MKRWLNFLALVLVVGAFSLTGCSSKEKVQDDPMMSTESSGSMETADASTADSYSDSANLGASSTGMGR